jgi:hypothetical protein
LLGLTASAADPKPSPVAVRDALCSDEHGQPSERREKLLSLVASHPDLVVARGHLGQVRQGKSWIDFEALVQQPEEIAKRTDYENARQSAGDTLDGQLELANWCLQHGLPGQERAHLARVLEFDPEHPAARARLGFIRRNGEWVSGVEQRLANKRQREQADSLLRWRPQVRSIVSVLAHKHKATGDDLGERERSLAKLAAITDPMAIPALELELAGYLQRVGSQPGSIEHKIENVIRPLMRAIGRIPQPQAAEHLARIATELALTVPMELPEAFTFDTYGPRYPSAAELAQVSPVANRLTREWAAAFLEAIQQLRQHPRDTFVPLLLSGLSSPIHGEFATYRERDGGVVLRLFYLRELEGRHERQENRTSYQPIGTHPDGLSRSISLSGERALRQLEAAHQQLQQVNQFVLHRNLRVTDVLRAVTDQPLSTEPQSWWNWWMAENEVFVEGGKPTVAKLQKQSITVLAPPPEPPLLPTAAVAYGGPSAGAGSVAMVSGGGDATDCLTAGTLIWTHRGHAPVESITTGDLVLAQHPATGELAYKPVLRTTRRPPSPLVVLQANGETFRTSGGHPFWVVGKGWVQARRLVASEKIHGINGPVTIDRVESSKDAEPTFNLVVADFHCYFAGRSRILSHDNTVRVPHDTSLPGIALTKRSSPEFPD